jgi:hypothetical protein
MWFYANPNPEQKDVPDCVIRAICIALNKPWDEVFDELSETAAEDHSITSDDRVWGHYLWNLGFIPFMLPESCPECITIKSFAEIFNRGIYIIGTGYHAVAVINGDYYDTWDSGNEVPTFYWKIC